MQYGGLPLFILLLAAIYLTAIYGLLKILEVYSKEESLSSSLNRAKYSASKYSLSLKPLIYMGYRYQNPNV